MVQIFERDSKCLRVLKDRFDHWLSAQPEAGRALLDYVINRADERLARRKAKDVARKTATRKLRLPGKLADCSAAGREGTEMRSFGRFSQGNVQMTSRQINDVVAYMRQWETNPPDSSARRRVQGDRARGKVAYASFCMGCHGVAQAQGFDFSFLSSALGEIGSTKATGFDPEALLEEGANVTAATRASARAIGVRGKD